MINIKITGKFDYQTFPITEDMILVDENDLQELGISKCFDIENNCVVDYDNSQELELKLLENELNSLYSWFEKYDNQVKQYERCKRLGTEFDKDINELDAQATINQKRISEIRQILKKEI